jgi:hypothetical protein
MEILNKIQQKIKTPKGQFNAHSNFRYRSCEDILESIKPLLGTATLILSDELVMLGDRFYIKSTATLSEGTESISNVAYARESAERKGMDASQITGASSSYARKYALNGLFLIDDTKDADTMDNSHAKETTHKKDNLNTTKKYYGEYPVCKVCGEIALPSKFPKPGNTHYCGNYRTCGKDTIIYPDKRSEFEKKVGAELDAIPEVNIELIK